MALEVPGPLSRDEMSCCQLKSCDMARGQTLRLSDVALEDHNHLHHESDIVYLQDDVYLQNLICIITSLNIT